MANSALQKMPLDENHQKNCHKLLNGITQILDEDVRDIGPPFRSIKNETSAIFMTTKQILKDRGDDQKCNEGQGH